MVQLNIINFQNEAKERYEMEISETKLSKFYTKWSLYVSLSLNNPNFITLLVPSGSPIINMIYCI